MKTAFQYFLVAFVILALYLCAAIIPTSTDLLECVGELESTNYSISKNIQTNHRIDNNWTEHLYVKKYLVGDGYGIGHTDSNTSNDCHSENRSITCGVDCSFSSEATNPICKDSWSMQWLDKDTGLYLYKSVIVNPNVDDRMVYKYDMKCKKVNKVLN